jgi:hypothetical protein
MGEQRSTEVLSDAWGGSAPGWRPKYGCCWRGHCWVMGSCRPRHCDAWAWVVVGVGEGFSPGLVPGVGRSLALGFRPGL